MHLKGGKNIETNSGIMRSFSERKISPSILRQPAKCEGRGAQVKTFRVFTEHRCHNSCYIPRHTSVAKWGGRGLTPKEIKPMSIFTFQGSKTARSAIIKIIFFIFYCPTDCKNIEYNSGIMRSRLSSEPKAENIKRFGEITSRVIFRIISC